MQSGAWHLYCGDLLAQNILIDIEAGPLHRPALIDWEYAVIGDPAYDLAIVTRGSRRPFKDTRGFEKLLDAYRAQGGVGLTGTDIGFYELCMQARWHREALRGEFDHPPGTTRGWLIGLLRRLEARASRET